MVERVSVYLRVSLDLYPNLNSRIQEDIEVLAELVGRHKETWKFGWGSHTTNSGAEEFSNGVFALRSFCWCDGSLAGHEEECPPNFEYFPDRLGIRWYKYMGRDNESTHLITEARWKRIYEDCLSSLPLSISGMMELRDQESSQCETCKETKESFAAQGKHHDVHMLVERGTCSSCYDAEIAKFDAWMHAQLDLDDD